MNCHLATYVYVLPEYHRTSTDSTVYRDRCRLSMDPRVGCCVLGLFADACFALLFFGAVVGMGVGMGVGVASWRRASLEMPSDPYGIRLCACGI